MELKRWLRAEVDRVVGAACVLAGVIALLLGYVGVADTPYPAEQIPYAISGGVLGIILVGVGVTAWLSADLRDEWRKLDRIEKLLERGANESLTDSANSPDVVVERVGEKTSRRRPMRATAS